MADDNWLDAASFTCRQCGAQLFRVIHSPYCDDHRLYCESCPRAIEISFNDANYQKHVTPLGPAPTRRQIMAAIEPLLRSCRCGGRFCDTAPRHCFSCGAVVLEAATRDLSPYMGCEDSDHDPTSEEQARYDVFEAEFIGRDELWA